MQASITVSRAAFGAVPAAHRRHLPDPRPAPRRMVRPRADRRGGHRPHQHGARPGRPGARGAHPRRQARGRARRHARTTKTSSPSCATSATSATHARRAAARRLRGDDAAQLRARDLPQAALAAARALDATPSSPASPARRVKEARYHQEHAADWVVRLGDGTAESAARMKAALDLLWPYFAEIFESRRDRRRSRRRRASARAGPTCATTGAPSSPPSSPPPAWRCPPSGRSAAPARSGRHSEHLGYVLAEMQHLQRAFPGGVW